MVIWDNSFHYWSAQKCTENIGDSDETDAETILTAFPFGELEETTRKPSYYVDEHYPAAPEIQQPFREWHSWRGSESSTLETDVYVWRFALLVVHARNEWMNTVCDN